MKSKILLKRTLPIIIALFVIVVVALVATVVTLDKKTPSLSKALGEENYLTYTNNGVTISMTNNDVYDLLRDTNYGASSSVTQLVRMIDEGLLTNGEKNYLNSVENEKVRERIEYAVLGYEFADYEKANKTGFELAAKKANKSYDEYLAEKVNDIIEDFIDDFLTMYGIKLNADDITFDGTKINAKADSKVFAYYALEEAKYLYAREYLEKNYSEDLKAYNEYLNAKEAYDKYTAALARYESDLATWKEASKKTRGDKPVKNDYISLYTVREEPEEVAAPAITETMVSNKYASDNVDKFWAVVINYSSVAAAKTALNQNGYIFEDNKYKTSAGVELTDDEVVQMYIKLYNQYYQNLGKDALTTAAFTPDWTDEDSEFYFTASDLLSRGIYSKNSTNKAYNYESGYAYNDKLSSNLYLIVARDKALTWDEYLEAQDKKYYETEYYTSVLADLLDDATTSTYINKALVTLRADSDLLIYDTVLEQVYMASYESDYKATKKASSSAVASYKVNGKKYEVSADDLFKALANTQYGVSSFIYKYQYNWMFLEATDKDGNLLNKYVDYKAYLDGASYKKASKDEAMYKDAKEYVDNLKTNFKANAYANEDGTGYNKKYGWNAFIRDYYYENYNVELNNEDDLMVFFVYQKLMDEYQASVTKITTSTWNDVYKIYMAKTASEYMSISAEELYIKLFDAEGSKVDPINWTAEQVAKAKALYDEVLSALTKIQESEISAFLSGLETAFDNAPKAIDGAYTGDYAYNYVYAVGDGTQITINVSEYKSYGFDVTSTSASFTNTSGDDYLKYAARQVWKSLMGELIKGKAVSELVVYDTTWTPKDYYGIGNANYLASSEGFVVLAFTSANYSSFFKTVGSTSSSSAAKTRVHALMASYEELHAADAGFESFEELFAEWVKADDKTASEAKILAVFKDKLAMDDVTAFSDVEDFFKTYVNDRYAFIAFPELEYVLMYLYDQSKKNEDDYVSLSDLYSDYEDAVKDNEGIDTAKEAVMKIVEKYINDASLNVNFTSFDAFLPYLTKYADSDTSAYYKASVTTWFTTYSSSSSTLVYGNFASTTYANREMFTTLLNNLNANFNASDEVKDVMNKLVETSIDNATSSLSYLAFTKGDKAAVESLLNAVLAIKDFDLSDEKVLDVLFTYGNEYSAEKTTFTAVMSTLSTYAKAQYQALSAEDKAELADLATAAGLVD